LLHQDKITAGQIDDVVKTLFKQIKVAKKKNCSKIAKDMGNPCFPRQKIVMMIVCIFIFIFILDLVRRRKLREEYSWLWLFTSLSLFILVIKYNRLL